MSNRATPNLEDAITLAARLKALTDPVRLQSLVYLMAQPMSVSMSPNGLIAVR